MSGLFDLGTLFSDIVPDTRASLKAQGVQESNAAQLPGGMAAMLAPQRFNNMRKAAGGLFGVDTSNARERLQTVLGQLDMSSPAGQKEAIRIVNAVSPKDALQLQNLFDTQAQNKAATEVNIANAETAKQNMLLRRGELEASALPSSDREIAQMVDREGQLTTILDDGQGNFFDLDNNPINIPQGFKVLESATLSGARDDLGLSDGVKNSLDEAEIAVRQFLDTGEDALALLKESPDVNTFVAKAAGIAIGLEQEVKALGRSFGIESDKVNELASSSEYDATFKGLGINEARMKGLITSLAFQAAMAAGESSSKLSNRDVERFIVEIGGNASNPEAFRAALVNVMERSVRGFKTKYSVLTREEYDGTLDFNRSLINDDGSSAGSRATLPASSGVVNTEDLQEATLPELLEMLK